MKYNFAYIKYRNTNEYDVVEIESLENFDEQFHSPTKCYYLHVTTCPDDDTDDDGTQSQRYKVQVLLLGDLL